MWTVSAILVISIVGFVMIRACVTMGLAVLVVPTVIAVLLLFIAVLLARRALRPHDDEYEAPQMPWYATADGSARSGAAPAPGPYVPRP